MRRPGKASRNPEEVAGRKWPAVQAGVVLRSGPGLKVDLWRNPSFNFGDAGLDWFQTQLLIVNVTTTGCSHHLFFHVFFYRLVRTGRLGRSTFHHVEFPPVE